MTLDTQVRIYTTGQGARFARPRLLPTATIFLFPPERYMSTPEDNPEGYQRGSILERISSFPDECVEPPFVAHVLCFSTTVHA